MKLTFAANHGDLGGGEVMLLTMVEVAKERGHDVTVVAPAEPRTVIERARALDVRTVPIHGKGLPAYLRKLRRWDRRERDGVLWCNGLRPAFATAGRPDRVVALHQLPSGPQAIAARVALAGSLMVTVPSEWMRRRVGLGARVLANWTAINPPAPEPFAGFQKEGPIRVGFLGRVTRSKGIVTLAEALAQLGTVKPGRYQLVIGGEARFADPKEADEIRAALDALDPAPIELGWVPPTEFFSQVDLAVFPSIAPESFGLVAAEAMALGVPFVITDAGALPDVSGLDRRFIAEPDDAGSLADVISSAVRTATLVDVESARHRWEQLYSPDGGRARFEKLLHELERAAS